MDVSRWMRGQNLPLGCTQPLPPGHLSGRHKKSLLRPWGESNLRPKNGTPNLPGLVDYRNEREKVAFERSRDEYKLWLQENSDKHMLVEEHDSILAGCATEYWQRTVQCIERELVAGLEAQLKSMPDDATIGTARQAIIAEARARHLAAVDAMQREFAGQDTQRRLEAWRRKPCLATNRTIE